MGPQELAGWLAWGRSGKEHGMGEYGLGGKGAMGYIGNAWIVRTKRWDEPYAWEVREDNWGDVASDEKEYDAIPRGSPPELNGKGFCRIEIRKLHPRRQDMQKLKLNLGNTYRKLLLEGKSTITVNGEEVTPLELPVYEGFTAESFDQKTVSGLRLHGWIGRLQRDHRSRGRVPIRGGMRLLREGRLICDGEFFGHPGPSYKQSLNTLIGEVDVGRVSVLPNKTDFDRESKQWEEVSSVLYGILKPHIQDLLSQKDDDIVTREERKRVNEVRRLLMEAVELLSKENEPPGGMGEGRGRKSPDLGKNRNHQPPNETGLSKNPTTPPPPDAVGRLKRLGTMPPWELRVLDPAIRSDWAIDQSSRILVINKAFPLYQDWKGHELYIAETAVLELAKSNDSESISVKEYLPEVNTLLVNFCKVWNSQS